MGEVPYWRSTLATYFFEFDRFYGASWRTHNAHEGPYPCLTPREEIDGSKALDHEWIILWDTYKDWVVNQFGQFREFYPHLFEDLFDKVLPGGDYWSRYLKEAGKTTINNSTFHISYYGLAGNLINLGGLCLRSWI